MYYCNLLSLVIYLVFVNSTCMDVPCNIKFEKAPPKDPPKKFKKKETPTKNKQKYLWIITSSDSLRKTCISKSSLVFLSKDKGIIPQCMTYGVIRPQYMNNDVRKRCIKVHASQADHMQYDATKTTCMFRWNIFFMNSEVISFLRFMNYLYVLFHLRFCKYDIYVYTLTPPLSRKANQ